MARPLRSHESQVSRLQGRTTTRFRAPLRTILLAVVAALAIPGGATARTIEHYHETFDFDATFELCGVPVDGHFEGVNTVVIGDDGRELITSRRTLEWTSLTTGRVVTFFGAGTASMSLGVTDNGDGTITSSYAVTGTQRITTEGRVLLVATGRIVFADILDLHDPGDPDDDELVTTEVVAVAGPHSDVSFCDVVGPALS